MKRITFYEVSKDELPLLESGLARYPAWQVSLLEAPLTAQTAVAAQESLIVSTFTRSRVNGEMLARLPRLRYLSTRATGFDNIDPGAAAGAGVQISNVPAYGDHTVAEYAFGLTLSLMRHFRPTWSRCEQGNFSRSGLLGRDVKGKTAGIIGTGRIGACYARFASAFGMQLLAYDPRPDTDLAAQLAMEYVALDTLLARADVITLHVPYLPATHHLLDEAKLRMTKRGVLIVNTARGAVVDTYALSHLLAEGHVGGAALDCFEGEEVWLGAPEITGTTHFEPVQVTAALVNFQLQQRPNVILTPHNAFNTGEAIGRIIDTTLENISAYLNGTPQNLVGASPQPERH